jgi:outer membrane lipoprotein
MKKRNLILTLPLLVSAIFLGGCSSIPALLQMPENTVLTNFVNVRENADSEQGKSARWGGIIAKVTNNADNTMVEVVHFPLKASARPKQGNETQGRFRVYFSGLLDPMIFKEGKSITAIGSVSISEQGKIGEHKYTYPILKASYIHLWKEIEKVDVNITKSPFWYTPSHWNYPRYNYFPKVVVVRKASKPVKSK